MEGIEDRESIFAKYPQIKQWCNLTRTWLHQLFSGDRHQYYRYPLKFSTLTLMVFCSTGEEALRIQDICQWIWDRIPFFSKGKYVKECTLVDGIARTVKGFTLFENYSGDKYKIAENAKCLFVKAPIYKAIKEMNLSLMQRSNVQKKPKCNKKQSVKSNLSKDNKNVKSVATSTEMLDLESRETPHTVFRTAPALLPMLPLDDSELVPNIHVRLAEQKRCSSLYHASSVSSVSQDKCRDTEQENKSFQNVVDDFSTPIVTIENVEGDTYEDEHPNDIKVCPSEKCSRSNQAYPSQKLVPYFSYIESSTSDDVVFVSKENELLSHVKKGDTLSEENTTVCEAADIKLTSHKPRRKSAEPEKLRTVTSKSQKMKKLRYQLRKGCVYKSINVHEKDEVLSRKALESSPKVVLVDIMKRPLDEIYKYVVKSHSEASVEIKSEELHKGKSLLPTVPNMLSPTENSPYVQAQPTKALQTTNKNRFFGMSQSHLQHPGLRTSENSMFQKCFLGVSPAKGLLNDNNQGTAINPQVRPQICPTLNQRKIEASTLKNDVSNCNVFRPTTNSINVQSSPVHKGSVHIQNPSILSQSPNRSLSLAVCKKQVQTAINSLTSMMIESSPTKSTFPETYDLVCINDDPVPSKSHCTASTSGQTDYVVSTSPQKYCNTSTSKQNICSNSRKNTIDYSVSHASTANCNMSHASPKSLSVSGSLPIQSPQIHEITSSSDANIQHVANSNAVSNIKKQSREIKKILLPVLSSNQNMKSTGGSKTMKSSVSIVNETIDLCSDDEDDDDIKITGVTPSKSHSLQSHLTVQRIGDVVFEKIAIVKNADYDSDSDCVEILDD